MISVQPVINLKYFQFKKNKLPNGVKELFYLSWEDALWDILIKKDIVKKSTILIPNFYCKDVEKNIQRHGYKIAYYKIKSNLSADKKSFTSSIAKYKPNVIVIFHPVGITSNLLENTNWLIDVTRDSILIEDSVHRTANPNDLKILKKNHFIIDSLRKVVPLQGARIFGRSEDLDFNVPPIFQSIFYAFKVNALWLLMLISWTLGMYKLAEKLMIQGYDLIGDSKLPARGLFINKFLSDRLNISYLQRCKEKQVNYYEKELNKILPVKLHILIDDKKHLRGFPVILPKKHANEILLASKRGGLFVRFELDGSEWAKKQKIIYLPLGIYMTEKQQEKVCDLIKSAILHS